MKWLAGIVIGVVVLLITALSAPLWMSREDHVRALEAAPPTLRRHYLRSTFNASSDKCIACYSRRVGALEWLERRIASGAETNIDLRVLLPLLQEDRGALSEPIPQKACNVLLMSGDARVYEALNRQVSQNNIGTANCIKFGFPRVVEHWPGVSGPMKSELARHKQLTDLLASGDNS